MSSRIPASDRDDLNQTLYRYGLSLAVLFDLLVEKGVLTRDDIRRHAQRLNHELLVDKRDPCDEEPWQPHP